MVQLNGGVVTAPHPEADHEISEVDGDFKTAEDQGFARETQQRRNGVRFPMSVLRVYLGPVCNERSCFCVRIYKYIL